MIDAQFPRGLRRVFTTTPNVIPAQAGIHKSRNRANGFRRSNLILSETSVSMGPRFRGDDKLERRLRRAVILCVSASLRFKATGAITVYR